MLTIRLPERMHDMDVKGLVDGVGQNRLSFARELVGSFHTLQVPLSPVHDLLKDGDRKWVRDFHEGNLTIASIQVSIPMRRVVKWLVLTESKSCSI